MKTSQLLPTLLLALPTIAAAVPIASDPFLTGADLSSGEYTDGANALIGQAPSIFDFSGPWIEAYGGAQSPDVVAGGLAYTGLPTSGGSISYSGAGSGRCGRLLSFPFTDTTSGTFYLSVLMQLESIGEHYRAVELHQGGFDDGGNRKFQIATGDTAGGTIPATDFTLRVNNSDANAFSLGAQDTDVNLFVVRIDFSADPGADTITVFRNPTDLAVEENNTATASLTGIDFAFDRWSFARFNETSEASFDEIRIGTLFTDVTTTPDTDTDTDDMHDGWEFLNMVDDPDGDVLLDNDDLTNLEEFNAGTNPRLADTDGDDIDDKPELDGTGNTFDGMPTDPTDPDSDDDTLTDGAEVSLDNGYITDPNDPDTDGDEESDALEIANGTDPRNKDNNSSTLGLFLVDGTRDALYGAPIVVQTVETGFGDNLNELNAAYAGFQDGKLYLLLTGNLEDSFNKLEIFFDTKTGGSTTFTSAGNDNTANMNGLEFDTGFEPDYHVIARRGDGKFDLDFADLRAAQWADYMDIFTTGTEGMTTTGTPSNSTFTTDPRPIGVAYDHSNTAGIGDTAGNAADQTAAAAVTTGIELCIDLRDLGNPSGEIKICAFINNSSHDFASNQFLGGLPELTGNLATANTIDLTTFAGDQFFTVTLPPEKIRFTSITYDRNTGEFVLEFTSDAEHSYLIESNSDFVGDLAGEWFEHEDSYPPDEGDTTTYTGTLDAPLPERTFFRVTERPALGQ